MVDLEGRATMAMARWGPGVHQQSIWNYRHSDGAPVSDEQAALRELIADLAATDNPTRRQEPAGTRAG